MGSKIYDCWERLVVAVVREEQLHELAMCHSRGSSILSESSSFGSSYHIHEETNFHGLNYEDYDWCIASPNDPSFFLMAESTNLTILCGDITKSDRVYYFNPCIRDFEAVKLETASWFMVRGRMKTFMLSRKTIYGAYLVFKLGNQFKGSRSAESTIRFFSKESDIDAEEQAKVVNFKTLYNFSSLDTEANASREDGWMEMQIGDFYIEQGSHFDDVEVSLYIEKGLGNTDLIVSGMEFRSLVYVKEA